jgi:hypothetical protein
LSKQNQIGVEYTIVKLIQEHDGLAIVFDKDFVNKFDLSAETAFEVKVENESIILQPTIQESRFERLVFERVGRNEFIARIA